MDKKKPIASKKRQELTGEQLIGNNHPMTSTYPVICEDKMALFHCLTFTNWGVTADRWTFTTYQVFCGRFPSLVNLLTVCLSIAIFILEQMPL